MSVNIKYKNNSIAELSDTGTKTLKTAGKYCEDDITVEYAKPAGGGGATEPYIEEVYNSNGDLIDVTFHGYTVIRAYLFNGCKFLTLTSLPSEIAKIGAYAFSGCKNIALTEIPPLVTKISDYTFSYCNKLAITRIPSGVLNIFQYAFQGCSGLSTITFEGTPTFIHSNAFSQCTNLTTINVPWAEGDVENAPWGATNATINYNYTGA